MNHWHLSRGILGLTLLMLGAGGAQANLYLAKPGEPAA